MISKYNRVQCFAKEDQERMHVHEHVSVSPKELWTDFVRVCIFDRDRGRIVPTSVEKLSNSHRVIGQLGKSSKS